MTNESCFIWKKRAAQLIVVLAILVVFFGSGCNTISPKLQDEYIRPGLSQGMCGVFDKYRQYFPEVMAKEKIPGLSIALVDHDGILWTAGFGYTDYNRKTPVTSDTVFAICSMSKTVTAVAVMVAVQDGLLDLDVPIVEYFPQFTVNSRFEENPHKKITLRHLLSHTSGIAHEAPVGNGREPSYGSLEEKVQSISDTWLRHKVGEGCSYSGLGYDLAAYILQIQSGQPFSEYLKDKVFTPLNMPNCSTDPEFIRNHPNRAIGHMPYVKRIPLTTDVPWVGAGGVYASAKELARFVQFFLNRGKVDGQTVLDESFIINMVTPLIQNTAYGMGVGIYPNNKYVHLGHGGSGLGFNSTMFWLPEYGIGGVYLYNSEYLNHSFSIAGELIDGNLVQKNESFEIPSAKYPAYQPLDPNTFTPFQPAWKKYIGTYEYIMSGWKLGVLMRIALGLGLSTEYTHVKVFEKDGYLYVDSIVFHDDDGGRLDEHIPGLFFTSTGKFLDLRGPKLTWQNFRIKKVDNDTSGKFSINLSRTTTHRKPDSSKTGQVEYEPTTEERARGFVAVQGSGPEPNARLKKLEVDLGRNERDLLPVKLLRLSELDAVSISVSGPGAVFCTPWIEKEYQLHTGDQAPLRLPNPARIWLEVDSHKHDPGVYELTVILSSGQGAELRIPATVTIHDVVLPQRRTLRMKPFSWVDNLTGLNISKPETRKRLEVFLDDMAALRNTVCDWGYMSNPANVLPHVKITGTDQTLQAAGQAGIIDINNLPDLDFSFFDPWIVGSVKRGMTELEIDVRLNISEHERAFVKAVLGNDIVCTDEISWKTLLWLYSQFRDYVQSRGMTETCARMGTALEPDMIPDYVQAARRYQQIGYRTYTASIDGFVRNATWLNQLNAQNDAWYMSYWQIQAFLALTRPAQGKAAVQLDDGDQIWYADNGNYTQPYEKARATAWRVCADGTHGYSWWCYWLDNSKNCIAWYDQEYERMIHSPTWHGLRDGNEDAAYYHILQERLKAEAYREGLSRLAALTGKSKGAPVHLTKVRDPYGGVYYDIDPTNGYRQFNQAKREVLRMLSADQRAQEKGSETKETKGNLGTIVK